MIGGIYCLVTWGKRRPPLHNEHDSFNTFELPYTVAPDAGLHATSASSWVDSGGLLFFLFFSLRTPCVRTATIRYQAICNYRLHTRSSALQSEAPQISTSTNLQPRDQIPKKLETKKSKTKKKKHGIDRPFYFSFPRVRYRFSISKCSAQSITGRFYPRPPKSPSTYTLLFSDPRLLELFHEPH